MKKPPKKKGSRRKSDADRLRDSLSKADLSRLRDMFAEIAKRPEFRAGHATAKQLAERAEYAVAAKHSRAERREVGRLPFADLEDVIRPYLRLHRQLTDEAIDALLDGPPGSLQRLVREIEDDARAKTGSATTEDLGTPEPAAWFVRATKGKLAADTLRKAERAKNIVGKKEGTRWVYSVASVLDYYGDRHGEAIRRAIEMRKQTGKQTGMAGNANVPA